jgi:alpha-beta hydrolase superfamily lysophospholipase
MDGERDVFTQFCSDVYFQNGIQSVCVQHPAPKRSIVYMHGNNEHISRCTGLLRHLSERCEANVYAAEYPGYSKHTGAPSEERCYDTLDRFVRLVVQRAAPGPIILMGYSMGGAPAAHAASASGVSGLVLVAPFVSAASVALAHTVQELSWSFLWAPVDVFRTPHLVTALSCPVLVVHGTDDALISCAHGKYLSGCAARGAFEEVRGALHSNILERCVEPIVQWASALGQTSDAARSA